MRGEIDVIIGPRSALFTPFSNLGLIVIDEKSMKWHIKASRHHHIMQGRRQFHSPDKNASVVLGSATPSVESYYNAKRHM